jgi:broad specificity phosphatase PhoE
MQVLTLVRHAETAWNAEGRLLGSTDLPLSPTGEWQAEQLRARLAAERFTAAFCSDKLRATATASAILEAHSGVLLTQTAVWRELDFGGAEGQLSLGVVREEHMLVDSLATRLRDWLSDLEAAPSEANVLVVAHGGPLRMLLCLLLGLPPERHWSFRVDCASVTVAARAPGLTTLMLLNDCSHLGNQSW